MVANFVDVSFVDFGHFVSLSLIRSVQFVRQTNSNTKKHNATQSIIYFLGVFPSFDKNVVLCAILIQFEDG